MANIDMQILLNAVDNTKQAFNKASSRMENFRGKMEKMQPAFQKMAIGGAAAFGGISFGMNKAIQESSAVKESINAVNTVFGEGANQVLQFGKNSAETVGLARSEFNQLATEVGTLVKKTGKPMEEVAATTNDLTVRAADLASVFNTDVSTAMSAINQAVRGETEAIRKYGGDVTQTALKQTALAQGIEKNVDAMTQQEKVQLRVQTIMQQTQQVAGDFQDTSDSLANKQRILAAKIQNASAVLGNTLRPMLKNIISAITPVVTKITEWVKENPELTKKIILLAGAIAGIVAVLGGLGLILPSIIAGFSGLIAVAGALLSPIGLIIGVIAALAIGIAYLWKNNEKFREIVIAVWQKVKDFIISAGEKIKKFWNTTGKDILKSTISIFKSIWKNIKPILEGIWEFIKMVFERLKAFWDRWGDTIIAAFRLIWKQIGLILKTGINIFKNVLGAFAALLKGDWSELWNRIKAIFENIWNLIEQSFKNSFDFLLVFFKDAKETIIEIWNKVKDFFKEWGEKISGFFDPVVEKIKTIIGLAGKVKNAISGVAGNAGGAIAGGFNSITPFAEGGIVRQPTLSLLGEAGPEAVVPLDKGAPGGNITVNINGGNFMDQDNAEMIGDMMIEKIKKKIKF